MRLRATRTITHGADRAIVDGGHVLAVFSRGELWDLAVILRPDEARIEAWPTPEYGPAHAELLYVLSPEKTPAMTRPQPVNVTPQPREGRRVLGSPKLPLVRDYDSEYGIAGLKVTNWYNGGNRWRLGVNDPNGLLASIDYVIEEEEA